MAHNLLAQTSIDIGTFEGIGPLGGENNPIDTVAGAAGTFAKIISNAVALMTIIAFIWFLFSLIIGAIGWLGAGGDKQKLQNSQKQITNALIGLVIVISAIFLAKIFGILLGVNILSIKGYIMTIWPWKSNYFLFFYFSLYLF